MPTQVMIGGDCHLVNLLWLHLYDRLQVTVVWIAAGIGVTLGPDSELSVWVLGHSVLGDNTRDKAHDICLKGAQEVSRGKAYVEDKRRLELRHVKT